MSDRETETQKERRTNEAHTKQAATQTNPSNSNNTHRGGGREKEPLVAKAGQTNKSRHTRSRCREGYIDTKLGAGWVLMTPRKD